MGYSATAKAMEALRKVSSLLRERYPYEDMQAGTLSNGWEYRRRRFFWEIGREQADGAVTGSVVEVIGKGLQKSAKRVGTFRIGPDGTVERFPYIPNRIKKEVQ